MEDEIVTASAAKQIIGGGAGLGDQLDPVPIGDPTLRAKQLSPERLAKAQAALKREARRIGYRFLLLHFQAKGRYALLRAELAILMVRADLERFLNKLVSRVGHKIPLARWFQR